MGELLGNITLQDSDKLVIAVIAVTIILLVLFIMYKIDSIPEDYKKKKKHNFETDDEPEEDEELENQIENNDSTSAEEKMEELFMNNEIEEKPSFQLLDFGNNEEPAAEVAKAEETVAEVAAPVAAAATVATQTASQVMPEQPVAPVTAQGNTANNDIDIYAGIDTETLTTEQPIEPVPAAEATYSEPVNTTMETPVAEPTYSEPVNATMETPVAEPTYSQPESVNTVMETPVAEPTYSEPVVATQPEQPQVATTNDDIDIYAGVNLEEPVTQTIEVQRESSEDLHEANDIFANMNSTQPEEIQRPVIEPQTMEENVEPQTTSEEPYSMFTDNEQ